MGNLALRLPELLPNCSNIEFIHPVSTFGEVSLRVLKPQEAGIVFLTQVRVCLFPNLVKSFFSQW